MTERDRIQVPLEIKASGTEGVFEGYGAIYNAVDRDGDIILPGCFKASLKERQPALLWQHNPKEPIGRFEEIAEDKHGLLVKGRLTQEGRGKEAYELLKMGALNGLSVGFVTKEATRDPKSGVRSIATADLMEISMVTFPANEAARIQTVKSTALPTIETLRQFERFLIKNGFSKSAAQLIAKKGFVAFLEEGELPQKIIERLTKGAASLTAG